MLDNKTGHARRRRRRAKVSGVNEGVVPEGTRQRLCPHSPLWLPRPPAPRHFPAALLSTTRSHTALADRSKNLPCPRTEPTLALSQMWRPHGDHRETYGCPDPTPFSTLPRRSPRMIRQFRSPLLGASHQPPAWCALLAPKPDPHFQPHLKPSPQPPQNITKPILLILILRYTTSARSLSLNPNTIQFA